MKIKTVNIKTKSIKTKVTGLLMALAVLLVTGNVNVRADVVTDWNRIAQQALLNANSSPVVSSRSMAIVQVSVFDAVNGIERRYAPVHVASDAPRGASRRAAAVQAAYAALLHLLPAQQAFLTEKRDASLAEIASESAAENSQSIARGIEWGQTVADEIFAWRSTDGITPAPPPFLGGMGAGEWRPTPPALLSGAGVQFSYMTPWALDTQSQFRASGPPALSSMQYAADLNEVKEIGSLSSLTRTADQTEIARFWNGNTPIAWNKAAVTLSEQKNLTLSDNSRLLALLNVAMADAVISCWEAKYYYHFWRPITAIRLADTDGNPDTTVDAGWTPLLVTPNHPDYPSGHATVSPAAAAVLRAYFADDSMFPLTSEILPGVTRNYSSITQAVDEAFDARIYGGIHFRSACRDGQAMGNQVGSLVVATVAPRLRGN
jgi:hypothetical protein